MTDHAALRDLSGGYVLGALSTQDRERFEAHLSGCESCRAEISSLAVLPGLLTRAGNDPQPVLPPRVVDRAAQEAGVGWEDLHRSRRMWRWVASAAAVLLILGVLIPRVSMEEAPVALEVAAGPVTGEVSIDARAWGTAVFLDLDDLPARDRYVAWVVDGDGTRQQAATWGPTPSGMAVVQGASSIATARVVEVRVTDGSGNETLLVAGS